MLLAMLAAMAAASASPSPRIGIGSYPESAGVERGVDVTVELVAEGESVRCRLLTPTEDRSANERACNSALQTGGRVSAKPVRRETRTWVLPAPPADYVPAQTAGARHVITTDDYPDQSVRDGERGTVTTRLLVDVEGRVERCDVLSTSGHKRLDQNTCRIATKRFRFVPATVAGQPVREVRLMTTDYWVQ